MDVSEGRGSAGKQKNVRLRRGLSRKQVEEGGWRMAQRSEVSQFSSRKKFFSLRDEINAV